MSEQQTTTIRYPLDSQADTDQCRRCSYQQDWQCQYGCLLTLAELAQRGQPLCVLEGRRATDG